MSYPRRLPRNLPLIGYTLLGATIAPVVTTAQTLEQTPAPTQATVVRAAPSTALAEPPPLDAPDRPASPVIEQPAVVETPTSEAGAPETTEDVAEAGDDVVKPPVAEVEVPTGPPPLPPCPHSDRLAAQVCARIRAEPPLTRLTLQGRSLRSLDLTTQFYAQRGYQPAWVDRRATTMAEDLLAAIDAAEEEGLQRADYAPDGLRRLVDAVQQGSRDDVELADIDLLLTDAYMTYGTHLSIGRMSPRKIDPNWATKPQARDLVGLLQGALSSQHIRESLQSVVPRSHGYIQLREMLHRYQAVAKKGGWPALAGHSTVCARLHDLGDDVDAPGTTSGCAPALRRFQKRHGLRESGNVDAATRSALSAPITTRMRQITLNMERFRWLPEDFGRRHILVNIPSFKMQVIEEGKAVIEANVVVGRQERQTPAFYANMVYIVLSPKWSVPRSIAVKDKLPLLKRSPYALSKMGIRVLNSGGREVNPGSVNWGAVSERNFNYLLRQDAGPRNALGGIKFMFPNPYNVYLHDTPTRHLFKQSVRMFSSGCIRISNPVELATHLLKFDPKWSREAVQRAASSGKQRVVNLPEPVPVYLVYGTAWPDVNGLVYFRNDVYQRDKLMIRALFGEQQNNKA